MNGCSLDLLNGVDSSRSVFALRLGQWTFVRAFHHAKASELGPFCYAAVVYAVLIDWALYKQMPALLVWIGVALVCAGGIWAIRFSSPSK